MQRTLASDSLRSRVENLSGASVWRIDRSMYFSEIAKRAGAATPPLKSTTSPSSSASIARWICQWRDEGESYKVLLLSAPESPDTLQLTVAEKNELLFQNGINFNDVPNWQKRGIGMYWEEYEKPARNPVTWADV